MMNIWIITDTHFGHQALIDENHRPANYESKIYKSISNNVKVEDILIHLGDFAFKEAKEHAKKFRESVKGRIWMVRGNHDSQSVNWYLSNGFDFVADSFIYEQFGEKILFSHIPQKNYGQFTINIHGHFHDFGEEKIKEHEPEIFEILSDKHHLIALETNNYQVVNLKTILKA